MRINSKKPKRKYTIKEKKQTNKLQVAKQGFEPAPQLPPAEKVRLLTTGPCDHCTNRSVKLILLQYCSLPFTLFEPCGAVFMMNSKINLWKNSSKEYFKAILRYVRVLFTLGLYNGRSMNALIFSVALAEVQVAVFSVVLNLPRQGFLATCRIGHCCVCRPLLFASEILCDLPTYSKQEMNKMSPSRLPCCLETQNAQ